MVQQVAGLPNNIDFLIKVVQHPGFAQTQATTAFFEHNMTDILKSLKAAPLATLTSHTKFGLVSLLNSVNQPNGSGVWSGSVGQMANWRNARTSKTSIKLLDTVETDAEVVVE